MPADCSNVHVVNPDMKVFTVVHKNDWVDLRYQPDIYQSILFSFTVAEWQKFCSMVADMVIPLQEGETNESK